VPLTEAILSNQLGLDCRRVLKLTLYKHAIQFTSKIFQTDFNHINEIPWNWQNVTKSTLREGCPLRGPLIPFEQSIMLEEDIMSSSHNGVLPGASTRDTLHPFCHQGDPCWRRFLFFFLFFSLSSVHPSASLPVCLSVCQSV